MRREGARFARSGSERLEIKGVFEGERLSPNPPLSGSASSQLGDESYESCEPGLPGVDSCP